MSQGSFAKSVSLSPLNIGRNEGCGNWSDIPNSSELHSRLPRMPNLAAETRALRILARVMAKSPRQLPDTILRLALELFGAGTAGISLLETQAGEPIIRWTKMAGVLKGHMGGFVQRHFSPCGVALDRKTPQLFSYPARYFPCLREIPVPVVEALVIPLSEPGPAGTIWLFSHDAGVVFDSEDVRLMTTLADFASSALGVIQSLDERLACADSATNSARQTAALHAQVEERKRAEDSLREFTGRLLQMRDEEQRRLARELHDSVGQLLVAMSLNHHRALAEKHLSPAAASALLENTSLLAQVSTEIRTISHLLHPPLLDEVGLAPGIRGYLEGFASRSPMRVRFEMAEKFGRLPRDLETAVFRIVQEGLTNVHRHSGSQTVTIRVVRFTEEVSVVVADAGTGMPKQKVCEIEAGLAPGVGLQGMRERVMQLGGRLRIRSNHRGTVVVARLPVRRGRTRLETRASLAL
jgi:signal transduction histidine kinase